MKRLILFKGGVETLEFFTEQMAAVWEKMGYSVFWYNLILQQASSSALVEFFKAHSSDEWYMFTFNFEGIAGEAGLYRDDGWNFWDWAGVKVVNVVVDHPLYYNKYIRKHPEKYIQLDIDEMHVAYMRRFFPEVHTEYMLTAGTELNYNRCIMPDKNYLSMQERPIDIIFTGNYTPKRILRKHLDNMDDEYIDFYEGVLSYLIDNPSETIDVAAENALRREFPDITDGQLVDCMPNMMYRIAARFFTRLTQLINLFTDKRRHIVHVVGRMGKSGVNGQQQMLFQHSLNDIFRRTNHIKILMSLFDLRQHDLVDIKCLINDADIFACLFFIVCLKVFEYPLAYIICPVIDFKDFLAWLTGIVTTAQRTGQDQ